MANHPGVAPKFLKTGILQYETPDPFHFAGQIPVSNKVEVTGRWVVASGGMYFSDTGNLGGQSEPSWNTKWVVLEADPYRGDLDEFKIIVSGPAFKSLKAAKFYAADGELLAIGRWARLQKAEHIHSIHHGIPDDSGEFIYLTSSALGRKHPTAYMFLLKDGKLECLGPCDSRYHFDFLHIEHKYPLPILTREE